MKGEITMKTKKTLTFFVLFSFLSLNAFAQVRLEGNPEGLNLFALSPDGETLAGSSFRGPIHLWDTATGAEKDVFIGEFRIGAGAVLTFSPDGTLLASGSEQRKVTLWDVATGKAKFVLEHVEAHSTSNLSFSPDGTTLAICAAGSWGTSSTFVYLWDVEAGEKKFEIEVLSFPVCSAYSPDGNTLAIGTRGKDVYLWDVHENIEIDRLNHPNFDVGVQYVKFSPDGNTLAAGSKSAGNQINRHQITLWDVVTRKETGLLYGYSGYAAWSQSFAFSPDGMKLAGIGTDGLYVWNVSNEVGKKIYGPTMFAGVSPNGTIYAVEHRHEVIDERWVLEPGAYFLWAISPEGVSMDVAPHDKLATSWADLKMSD